MISPLNTALESPHHADVIALIEQLDAYQASLYPAASNHLLDIKSLQQPNVLFAVMRDRGQAVACGAVVLKHGFGELKRMFVRPDYRGRRLGKTLLAFLEQQARSRGCSIVRLETGIHQPEALALYESTGYQRRSAFIGYDEDPLSVYMEKRLGE